MQTTPGEKLFSFSALLLITVATFIPLSVEKLSVRRASAATLRTSRGTPQSVSSDSKAIKIESKTKSVKARAAKILMIASWYGEQFQGRLTASGELFDLNQLTAASKTLPLGTRVKLTAPSTGRSVVVRINDRGPWVKGRDFDLSEAAAIGLGIHDKGIAAVEMALAK